MSRLPLVIIALATSAGVFVAASPSVATEAAQRMPVPLVVESNAPRFETAVFAGGCFWGVEGVYDHVDGVVRATSGYAGGARGTATYEQVSDGTTGHAESVRIVFDTTKVSYAQLLRIYFSVVADPTELNRQGPDQGTQYRSAIFPQSPAQERVARAYIAQLGVAHAFQRPIVTRIEPAGAFYPAEAHHQNFMAHNPNYPYIVINDRPKVDALRRLFPTNWRS